MKKIVQSIISISMLITLSSCRDDTIEENVAKECATQVDAFNMLATAQVPTSRMQKEYQMAKNVYDEAYKKYKSEKLNDSAKLKKINKLQSKMAEISQNTYNYQKEISDVTRIINQKEYKKACNAFKEIATKYGFDLDNPVNKTIPLQKLNTQNKTCDLARGSITFMNFIEASSKKKLSNDPLVKKLMIDATALSLQNPAKLCKRIEETSDKLNISYADIVNKTNKKIAQNKTISENSNKIPVKNKECSVNDAIELYYRESDFNKKFSLLRDKWGERRKNIKWNAATATQERRIIKAKTKKLELESNSFSNSFKQDVKINITDTKNYDMACENYAKLIKKYTNVLLELTKEYNEFDMKKEIKKVNNAPKPISNPKDKNNTNDSLAIKKYNYFVEMINQVTPKMSRTFSVYTRECGANKNKRVHAKVEMALKMSGGANRKEYEEQFGYHFSKPYSKVAKEKIVATFNKALEIDRFGYADSVIKEFKASVTEFIDLYSEDAEYFNMKDYTDDNFKKANELHAPIITAYENIIKSNRALRKIINEIVDKYTLAKIEAFKKNNQMLFYHVEKSQYLSKKFFEYGEHKKNYLNLDAQEVRKKHDELRKEYEEFKIYKEDNAAVFADNTQYNYYLEKFKAYVSASKEFYFKVKSKKLFTKSEQEIQKYIPAVARQAMTVNKEGSLSNLLKYYNSLVNELNFRT